MDLPACRQAGELRRGGSSFRSRRAKELRQEVARRRRETPAQCRKRYQKPREPAATGCLGEALAETEMRRNTLIHRFLSPRFTGLKIIFHLLAGAALTIVRLPLPEFFRPYRAHVLRSPAARMEYQSHATASLCSRANSKGQRTNSEGRSNSSAGWRPRAFGRASLPCRQGEFRSLAACRGGIW